MTYVMMHYEGHPVSSYYVIVEFASIQIFFGATVIGRYFEESSFFFFFFSSDLPDNLIHSNNRFFAISKDLSERKFMKIAQEMYNLV